MTPPDELLYEYAVIRYVPRIDREEFINIGLIMLCKRQKWLHGKIMLDSLRLSSFDPQIKLESLKRQSEIFELSHIPFPDFPPEEKFRWLTAPKSAVLQTSNPHPGIIMRKNNKETCENLLINEFNRLFLELVVI